MRTKYDERILKIDAAKEITHIVDSIKDIVSKRLKRQGVVVALSGGIDSSVVAALCVKALGPEKVFGIQMPDCHSAADTKHLSDMIAKHLHIETHFQDITSILKAIGCYEKQIAAYQKVIPQYGPGWSAKIVLPDVLTENSLRLYYVIAVDPEGTMLKKRLSHKAYLEIVAATNFKQRVRKMLEYYHADRLNYAVAGTHNRLEYDQGFFVKVGDGAADLKPIAHMYKTQVYQIAEYLSIPEEIRTRPPSADTYQLPQTQEEFYFSLPYDKMDLCLYGKNHNLPDADVASAAGITTDQLRRVYADIDQKRRTSAYLHLPPQLIDDVREINNHSRTGYPVTHQ